MAIESASYISELVATNPAGGDDYATADDHLRLVKAVLKTQFPNLTAAAVTATVAELNKLDGFTGLVADLNILSGAAAAGLTATELLLLNGQRKIHAIDSPTKSNDATPADDGTLSLAVTSGKYYKIEAFVSFGTDDETKQFRVGISAPLSSTFSLYTLSEGAPGFPGVVHARQDAVLITFHPTGQKHAVSIIGQFKSAATDVVALQWAQGVADAGWTLTREPGAWMTLTELG